DRDMQRERVAWMNRMVKKGSQTPSQADAEQAKLESYELALKKVREEHRVLTDPTFGMKKRTERDLDNKVREAELALGRAKSQAKSKEAQGRAVREAKKSIYAQEKQRYEDVLEEIKKCKIYAPQDGMVVYYVSEQSRFGSGSQQSIIAQ